MPPGFPCVCIRGGGIPGIYPITRAGHALSEAIQRAGGPTAFAALRSAQLVRREKTSAEIEYERLESLRGGVMPDNSSVLPP